MGVFRINSAVLVRLEGVFFRLWMLSGLIRISSSYASSLSLQAPRIKEADFPVAITLVFFFIILWIKSLISWVYR